FCVAVCTVDCNEVNGNAVLNILNEESVVLTEKEPFNNAACISCKYVCKLCCKCVNSCNAFGSLVCLKLCNLNIKEKAGCFKETVVNTCKEICDEVYNCLKVSCCEYVNLIIEKSTE
ncbi:MAG: hypothetical protein IJ349_05865, partial [Clostridia bacterium]|nr:hypothetical protein [Clostridia bacterium]